MIRALSIAFLAASLAGCLSIPNGVFFCNVDADCPSNFTCSSDNRCYERATWTCSNEETISSDLLCDGRPDCKDGSDEAKCELRECASGGQSIPAARFCDGNQDCADGSDEDADICMLVPCRDTETVATDTLIPAAWLCDGHVDCPPYVRDPNRAVDESQCIPCGNSRVVHSYFVCDLVDDCGNGYDEAECFYCDGVGDTMRNRLPRWALCDGTPDCPAGQDETGCATFTCPNDKVVKGYFICDQWDDCATCDGFGNCTPGNQDETVEACTVHPSDRAFPEFWPATYSCDGQTLHTFQLCEGVSACSDGSDEIRDNCPYVCDNGRRIPREWLCDGQPDCEGGEDESTQDVGGPCAPAIEE